MEWDTDYINVTIDFTSPLYISLPPLKQKDTFHITYMFNL